MKIVAVVQARVGSTRLPGKVLLPLRGRPLLERMLLRLREAHAVDELVVATTTHTADRSIVALASNLRLRVVTGHATDLIDRHLLAARAVDADVVVKIPSDCPLIDPEIVDRVVTAFTNNPNRFDYVSNLHPPTWPDGNDVEVMSRHALEQAFTEASRPYEREHATPFIWDQPERFRLGNVEWGQGRDLSGSHRLTLDYSEDYEVIAAVFDALDRGGTPPAFTVDQIVDFLDAHPKIKEHNARHRGPGWVTGHRHELRTSDTGPATTRMPEERPA